MRISSMRIAALCQLAIALGGAFAALAGPAPGPCRQIVAACQEAGFTQGARRSGEGLQVDCVRPIMQGSAQPRRASKPLPQIDPQLVAACKAVNPNFGQGNAPPAEPGTPPNPPPNPPPPAAGGPTTLAPAPAFPTGARRPNIVFNLADDFSNDLVQYMPHVLKMQERASRPV